MKELKMRSQQIFLKFLLFSISTALALLVCEVVLQFVIRSIHTKGYYLWPPNIKAVFKPSPDIMPGVSGNAELKTSSLGIRGDELTPQHTHRILAIGGSTTICGYLDQSETWTSLLQETLNRNAQKQCVWVGNGGMSGLNTNHHVMAVQYLPLRELKIDTVIILTGVNDLSRRLSNDKSYDPDYMSRPEAKSELLLQTFTGTYDSYIEDPFYKRTATWQMLRRAKRLMSRAHVEDECGKIYIAWREHRRQAAEIRDELPDLSSALKEYTRNLNKIIEIAQGKSIRLIFMTQPTMWKPSLPKELDALLWLGGVGDFQNDSGKPYYSAAALEKGMKAYNDTLLRVCWEKRIECIDLASMLEADTTVFYDDVHFNESGARKVAEALSRYMIERSPFRESQVAH